MTLPSFPIPFRFMLGLAAAAAALFGATPTAVGQVDLVADSAYGPGRVYLNTSVTVNINVQSIGDPLVGDYVAEVILSNDMVVDAGDTVVATVINDFYGLQTVVASIPSNMQEGIYAWGLRVLPAAGEVSLANNDRLTDPVEVARTEIELEDSGPLQVFVRASDAELATVPVVVNNAGSLGSVLIFTVQDLGAMPWLDIDPLSSFSIAGDPGNAINLTFDHTSLEPGAYSTTLRFTNYNLPSDTQDLLVEFTVGEAFFVPGVKIEGQISSGADVDSMQFDGLAGMRLKLRVKATSGDIKPSATFVDPDGLVEKVITFKHTGKYVTKSYKLQKTGEYTLEMRGATGSGGYKITTDRLLPKKARHHKQKVTAPGGGLAECEVLLLPGAILEFAAHPNARFAGPLGLGLTTPGGSAFDVGPFASPGDGNDLIVEGIELEDSGAAVISITGFGADPKAKVTMTMLPVQPEKGKGKIYLK